MILEKVKIIAPSFSHIIEVPICGDDGQEVGWISSCILKNGFVESTGTSVSKNLARRKAISELVERNLFKLCASIDGDLFQLEQYPTSSGCAAGLQLFSTKMRSIFEAVERRAWSLWIDFGHPLEKTTKPLLLTKVADWHLKNFEQVIFLKASISVLNKFERLTNIKFNVVLGMTENGIFPGSAVSTNEEHNWEHASVEAYRNLIISQRQKRKIMEQEKSIILDRILYFAENKQEALSQIRFQNTPQVLPECNIMFHEKINPLTTAPFYFYRSICENYVSWDKGTSKRFVY